MKTQSPQFSTVELLKAASIAQIDPASIPANANPWSWNDSRALSWQSAFRSLNPAMAQEAEVSFGPPLSLALQAALDELIPMTIDLERELSIKRPHQHQQMQKAAVDEAIARMQEGMEVERTRRAEMTPSPEALQRQLMASKEAAAAHLRDAPNGCWSAPFQKQRAAPAAMDAAPSSRCFAPCSGTAFGIPPTRTGVMCSNRSMAKGSRCSAMTAGR
jgi:hypothetical protein